jgi:hypothetical protein
MATRYRVQSSLHLYVNKARVAVVAISISESTIGPRTSGTCHTFQAAPAMTMRHLREYGHAVDTLRPCGGEISAAAEYCALLTHHDDASSQPIVGT